uniref:Alpha-1,4 glucan phosphorylase L isozyme, chloroplastic/amyloplastic n=2 Tax=Fabeae TaxID=163743 RepID=PHSL_VICFA|nr:RecName: Full=Alpha-1,4 glucan phosphorylase L isozyme, chloroplastic/amyloplastic; AltName: Full=Starch phosphorylase L; Flags: Precursor [Vicia faba]CAA85354.1 alpha-1,4 glucan phosphorylase, L isoform precursor [Vicia faba var. minor]
MASMTMRFHPNSTAVTESVPRRGSVYGFIGYRSSSLFVRTNVIKYRSVKRNLEFRRRSAFSVKCGSGNEAKQKVKDQEVQQEAKTSPSSFAPDTTSIVSSIKYHAEFTPLFSPEKFELPQAFIATAQSVRDALIINWNATYDYYEKLNVKQAYYLSMEFLQGRALLNAIGNLELTGPYAEALSQLSYKLEDVAHQEPDAALGNGGLGRLASCFLDSLATLNYPAWGYGLRYKYGLFKQRITKDGQEEVAEDWLEMGNPWEIVRNDVSYPVRFYGKVVSGSDGKKHWVGGEDIKAVAHDVPIPGYKTRSTINLRLWSTKAASEEFDLNAFNSGRHTEASEALANAEKICYILYPGDESIEGKTLRLKQQYTLCSASLQDIIARFERRSGASVNWEDFPEKVAVQMNDTHPTLCIPELMRILIDIKGLSWKDAWNITQRTVAYTNHTVLPEALEKWSMDLMEKLLPRHVEIIEMIDEELIRTIIAEYGTADSDLLDKKLKEMRILENVELPAEFADILVKTKEATDISSEEVQISKEGGEEEETSKEGGEEEEEKEVGGGREEGDDGKEDEVEKAIAEKDGTVKSSIGDKKKKLPEPVPVPPKLVRMANLCVVGGHAVNGVAEIHSEIVKDDVFNAFYKLWPEKFQNKTNGVTPRRWIRFCNPDLSKIITQWIGTEDWILNTEKLAELRKFADNEDLQTQWREAKRNNKVKVAAFLRERTGYSVSPDSMFDIQVKRIHEYKRQLLNIFGIVYRYKKMKEMNAAERKENFVPRVCIFGGKAFATYVQAKRIVKFITDVGATVNHDPEIGDLLKVIFVPDYNVSVAEMLIPASELSQHISTAGMEASGTSNMKFAMNGCLQIGTLDGANVEIREEVGADNFFLFGAKAREIVGLRKERARGKFVPDPRFEEVKKFVRSGVFGSYNYDELIGSLEGNEGFGRADYFLVGQDFPSYLECQEEVDKAYRDQKKWTRMSILNTAGSSKFSSDRTIHEYAREIWNIEPVKLE